MLSEQQLVALPERLQEQFKRLEKDFIDRICKRIGEIGSLTATDLHRLDELSRIGFDVAAMEADIAKTLEISERDVRKILHNAAEQEYNGVAYDMAKIRRDVIPFAENEHLQTLIDSISKTISGEVRNISKTLGFVNSRNKNNVLLKKGEWQNLSTYYQNAVDYAVLQIRTGQTDFYSAMRSTVNTMSDYGLRYAVDESGKVIAGNAVTYASGYTRRLDTSVRSAILGGQARLSQAQAELVGQQIDADGYEITWHSGFRPTHTFGGEQYSFKAFEDEGIRDLMDEPNCYHRKFPIVMGLSTPTYSKAELAELNAAEKETHEWRGKSYNKYESTQRQRQYETVIRQYKDRATAYESAATDDLKKNDPEAYRQFKEAATAAKGKVTAINQEYAQFSRAMGAYTQPKRASVSGYTRGENLASVDGKKDTYFLLGKVDFNDKNMLQSTLEKYEKIIVNKDYENAIVITTSGNVYRVIGNEYSVNPKVINEDLHGSWFTHNHPTGETRLSFSGDDIQWFFEYNYPTMRGIDYEYIYEIKRTPRTSKVFPANIDYEFTHSYHNEALQAALDEKIDIDTDEYDYINNLLAEEYGYGYRREKRLQ